jgi:hypothetical protein
MRFVHSRMLVVAALAVASVSSMAGCAGSSRTAATEVAAPSPDASTSPQAVSPSVPISEDQAREIALRTAAAEGYDNATYPVTSLQREADGTWTVFLEHIPPTPPGAHCIVTVSPDGTARLAHGE